MLSLPLALLLGLVPLMFSSETASNFPSTHPSSWSAGSMRTQTSFMCTLRLRGGGEKGLDVVPRRKDVVSRLEASSGSHRHVVQEFREKVEQQAASRRKMEAMAGAAMKMGGRAQDLGDELERRGKAPWMIDIERKRLEEVLMESCSEVMDDGIEDLIPGEESEENQCDDDGPHMSQARQGMARRNSRRKDTRVETDLQRLARLKRELDSLVANGDMPHRDAHRKQPRKPEVTKKDLADSGEEEDQEDTALVNQLDDAAWGALSSFSVSDQSEDEGADNEMKNVREDPRKERALRRQEEDLERGMPPLIRSMAVEFKQAGYVRYQCTFCPKDFEGASSYMATWRHVWSEHMNYLRCQDVVVEAAKERRERELEQKRNMEELLEGKRLKKQRQIDIMRARQREADQMRIQQREDKMQKWAWTQQKRIEVRRAVKEHKQAVDKGAMRFHPKWGYVPNDVKPKRYGNRVNGKRSKKFVW